MCSAASAHSVQIAAEALLRACECRADDLGRDFNIAFPPVREIPGDMVAMLSRIDARTKGGRS